MTRQEDIKINNIASLILFVSALLEKGEIPNTSIINRTPIIEKVIDYLNKHAPDDLKSRLSIDNYNLYRMNYRTYDKNVTTTIPIFAITKKELKNDDYYGIFKSFYKTYDTSNNEVFYYNYIILGEDSDGAITIKDFSSLCEIVEDINKLFFHNLHLNYIELEFITLLSIYENRHEIKIKDSKDDKISDYWDLSAISEYINKEYTKYPKKELHNLFINLKYLEFTK